MQTEKEQNRPHQDAPQGEEVKNSQNCKGCDKDCERDRGNEACCQVDKKCCKVDEESASQEKLVRLQADFKNYEKRMLKERAEWVTRANERLLLTLMPVLQDLQRALQLSQSLPAETVKGLTLIQDKLQKTLEKVGVTPIEVKVGSAIEDENLIEVISAFPTEKAEEKDTIRQVVEPGYLYEGRILQRAKVIINQ